MRACQIAVIVALGTTAFAATASADVLLPLESENASAASCWSSVSNTGYAGYTFAFSGGLTRECGTANRPLIFTIPSGSWNWSLRGLVPNPNSTTWRWSTDGGSTWNVVTSGDGGAGPRLDTLASGTLPTGTTELRVEWVNGTGWLSVDDIELTPVTVKLESDDASASSCWSSVPDNGYAGHTFDFSGGFTRECGTANRPLIFTIPSGSWNWSLRGLVPNPNHTTWRWSTDGGSTWTVVTSGDGGSARVDTLASGTLPAGTTELRVEWVSGTGWLSVDDIELTPRAMVPLESEYASAASCWSSVSDTGYPGLTLNFSGGFTRECGTTNRPLIFSIPSGSWNWSLRGLVPNPNSTTWRWSTDGGSTWTVVTSGDSGNARLDTLASGTLPAGTTELRVEWVSGTGWLSVDDIELRNAPEPA